MTDHISESATEVLHLLKKLPKAILFELQYLPPVQYFTKFIVHDKVYLECHENYGKRSYRNRCHISGANGLLRLSVPLQKGKNQQTPIRKVRIAYEESWQAQHWQSIQSAYGSAPFFEFYADYFRPVFEQKYEFLFDWNRALLVQTLELLQLPQTECSPQFWHKPPDDVLDFRNTISPKDAPGAKDHYFEPQPYVQIFADKHGFQPNLSILDLLFCTGPEALVTLQRSIKRE